MKLIKVAQWISVGDAVNEKNKVKKNVLVLLIILVIIVLMIAFVFDRRLHDRNKPNIFEIPGTASVWSPDNINNARTMCFFIQKLPETHNEIKETVTDYISENRLVEEQLKDDIEILELRFYKPSLSLPVYFEENKSFWEMDDYIDHYKDELIIKVIIRTNGDWEYILF